MDFVSCRFAFIHSFIHSFIHPFIHSSIHSFIHSFIQPFIQSLHITAVVFTFTFRCLLGECSEVFTSKSERETHLKIHRRFVCPFPGCQKPFTRKSYLDVHARSHTNERPYKCSYQVCDIIPPFVEELPAHLIQSPQAITWKYRSVVATLLQCNVIR